LGRFRRLLSLAAVLMLAGCGAERRQASVLPTTLTPDPPPVAPQQAPPPAPLVTAKPKSPSTAAPRADSVADLLERTDALYQAGVKDYNAGNFDQAKSEFDQALSVLLASNLDVQSSERLSSEFDHLVENIYNLERAAVERGDTLSAHAYEPTPIESFAGLTFPVDPNIRERAQQELASVKSDLPLVSNDYVDGALTFLQNHGRHFIQTLLQRRGYYGPMIEQTLRQQGLPEDLIFLAAGESAFNPFAVSKAGAKGIWQFMLGTGELYGLKKTRWVDEREDPVKSTEAAARHLKDLYKTFGDWFLAMAAYDWNPAGVQKAIEKTGYADFWKLRELRALPAETENYVPIFLAIALIAKDPNGYGFDVPADPPRAVDQVVVSEPTDLRLVAGLIDHPVEDLVRLNPSMLTWVTPPNESSFVLDLPAGTKEQYEKSVAMIPPARREWWRAYRPGSDDTLATVARKFHLTVASLAEANHLTSGAPLEAGSHLVVPLGPASEASLVRVHERGLRRAEQYRVRRGDTLELVADRFDVTPYDLRRWNHLSSSALSAGRSLVVYVPKAGRSSGERHPSGSTEHRDRRSSHSHLVARSSAQTGLGSSPAAR
jgi:peptidoglycan lytic transglycosylase D